MILLVFFGGCAAAPSTPSPPDWSRAGRESVELLRRMIRTDTINPPQAGSPKRNADETALLRWVQRLLAAEGIRSEIYESAPGRGNLVARYRGNGKKRPLLVMAHVDVVGVQPDMWTVPPLSGEIRGGFVWGRGAIDDKGMAALGVQVMRTLARSRPVLERDVILMLNGDEESGGHHGAEYMRDRHWDKIECAYVLNEGGRIALEGEDRIARVSVSASEKVYNDFRLWIPGASGHSSVPRTPNALFDLAAILSALRDFERPVRITPTARAHFAQAAGLPENSSYRTLMERVGRGEEGAARVLAALRPDFNAHLRSTVVPTLLRGGIRVNVLPPSAEVNFNARLLPGDRLEDLIRAMAAHAKLAEVEILTKEESDRRPAERRTKPLFIVDMREVDAPESPWKGEVLEAIRSVTKRLAPGAAVLPVMLSGATDARFFREKGIPSYGIHPCPTGLVEIASVHNHNERVREASVKWGARWLYEVVVELAR